MFEKFKSGLSLMMLPIVFSLLFLIGSTINDAHSAKQTKDNINNTYQKSLKKDLKPVSIDVVTVTNDGDNFVIVGKNSNAKIVTYQVDKLPTIDNQKIKGYYSGSRIYSSPAQYKNRIQDTRDFSLDTLAKLNHTNMMINITLITLEIVGLIVIYILNLKLKDSEAETKKLLKEA